MPKAVIGQWTSKNERFTKVLKSGLVRERKGKNSDLKVTDPDGNKGGQCIRPD